MLLQGPPAMTRPLRYTLRSALALSLTCLALGLLAATAGIMQQPLAGDIGIGFGLVGMLAGLSCAGLGLAVKHWQDLAA